MGSQYFDFLKEINVSVKHSDVLHEQIEDSFQNLHLEAIAER